MICVSCCDWGGEAGRGRDFEKRDHSAVANVNAHPFTDTARKDHCPDVEELFQSIHEIGKSMPWTAKLSSRPTEDMELQPTVTADEETAWLATFPEVL
jgi:hypothetical protein